MKIIVENLGILRKAEFELGNLTLICGSNNTGKTYATYALFGFLRHWPSFMEIEVRQENINELSSNGITRIDVAGYADKMSGYLKEGCIRYGENLSRIFASRPNYFKNAGIQIILKPDPDALKRPFRRTIRMGESEVFSLIKNAAENELKVSWLNKDAGFPPPEMVKDLIAHALVDLFFGKLVPRTFISSAERTGAAIFRKELNFARNRLLEEMHQTNKEIDPLELLFKSYDDYALPVKANADFIRQLETIAKQDSWLIENHRQVLNDFADIIGGEYIASGNDTLYYQPSSTRIKLTMGESSSAVRSLLDIGFYLRHIAKPGDLLMVDEPELNLHPENQCRIARLFSRLVNLGIKVFITTHSDYIVKELNTLIMLNQDKPHLKRIADLQGYQSEEFLNHEKVKAYIAEKALVKLGHNKRRSRCLTFVAADIDSDQGIEARSFDKTINKMNEIQEAITWEGDQDE